MPTDLSRLISSLNNSKIRSGGQDRQDPALYQVIFTLIKELQANKAIQGEAAPTAHATTHYAPGTDPVDILQLSGYTGTTTDFLRADGTWQLNSGSGITQLTGDVAAGPGTGSVVSTIANNAITTVKVADGQITYAKIQDVSAASLLLGRGSAAGSGDVQEIAIDTTSMAMTGTILSALTSTGSGITQLTGDVVAGPGSGSQVSTIQNNVVTFAKFQTCAESRLIGRGQGSGAGNVQEIVLGTNLTFTGTTISASSGSVAYAQYNDEKSLGTPGGTFTAGAWQTRTLNTEAADSGGFGSLSSNQITLSTGTYVVSAHAPAFATRLNQLRLQNITDTTTILFGGPVNAAVTAGVEAQVSMAFVEGLFIIATPKTIELQHTCQTTRATDGFGFAGSFTTEVYAVVKLWKIA